MQYLILIVLSLYSCYYTVRFSLKVWKEGKPIATVSLILFAITPVFISVLRFFVHD